MSGIRVTVASNTKQSQKSPLIIPAYALSVPLSESACQTIVYKTAQSKLRLKKPSRIFVAGTGQELSTAEDWRAVLKNDITLLVSAGEDYVGTTKDTSASAALAKLNLDNPKPTISILSNSAYVDQTSVQQLETTANTLPGILHGIGQPDLHPGNKFPIGAVFVSKDWIHPPLIGGDIGCGMAWYKAMLTPSQVLGDKGQRIANSLRGLEGPWRSQEDRIAWLSSDCADDASPPSAGETFDASLGTIGAGNHFAELQIVESLVKGPWASTEDSSALRIGDVVLLVHSGSRGYGGDILKRFTVDNTSSMRTSDPKAAAYLSEHDRACAWADHNRDLIALRFLSCLEPSNPAWSLGDNDSGSPAGQERIHSAHNHIQSRKVAQICHNNMTQALWPHHAPAEKQERVYIHRKGAAPIHRFVTSQDVDISQSTSSDSMLKILPLPGSRGTPTLILHPTLSQKNEYGATNALSLAHGAGRAMSRAKALSSLAGKYKGDAEAILRGDFVMGKGKVLKADSGGFASGDGELSELEREMEAQEKEGRRVHGGTWVVCEDKQLVWEEAPEAYKDVWDVGRDLVEAGACRRVGWCRGVVSYKVRKE